MLTAWQRGERGAGFRCWYAIDFRPGLRGSAGGPGQGLPGQSGTRALCDGGGAERRRPADRSLPVSRVSGGKARARRAALEGLARETATLVFYESPHRISDFLDDVVDVLGAGREVVVARELTKSFETFYSGSASDVRQQVGEDSHGTRGEFVVMVRGADLTANAPDAVDVDRMLAMLVAELPVKKVARLVAELTGLPKNELYQRALRLRED